LTVLLNLACRRLADSLLDLIDGTIGHIRRDDLENRIPNENRATTVDQLSEVSLIGLDPDRLVAAPALDQLLKLVLHLDVGVAFQVERISPDMHRVLVDRDDSHAIADVAPTPGNLAGELHTR